MARASSQRKRRTRTPAPPKSDKPKRRASSAEDLMFFPRLRRRAKWVFLLLAVFFAFGFVAFGVGAGGSGIGDYFSDLFNRNSVASGQPSVEDAQRKVAENPNDPKARLELANALQAAKRPEDAIKELERYVALRPKDADALQQLGALYDQRALSARRDLAAAQAGAPGSAFGQDLANPSSPLSQALGQGAINDIEQQRASEVQNAAIAAITAAYTKEADIYQQLIELRPDEPSLLLTLGQVEYFSGDTNAAIVAYKRFLELAPDDPSASLVKQELKRLQSAAVPQGTG
jgi:tetratricopeptide (TPR) repeat protein